MADTIHGPIGQALGGLGNAYKWWTGIEGARNEHERNIWRLRRQGISPFDALHMSNLITYHDYNRNPQTQANLLAMLKQLGYLPYQAR